MMSGQTAQKWDQKYAQATLNTPAHPCYVLKQHSQLLPFKGVALDLACGLGGNARFLAQCGLKVQAWDISDNALTILNNWASLNRLPIEPLITDLEQMLLPFQQFDVIVVSRYLQRDLFKQIEAALKPGGVLFYQTFLAPLQANGPSRAEWYVNSGEFNQAWSNLHTLLYGEGWLENENSEDPTHHRQRYAWYVGKKPS
jgi:SAM-dependent methyltransferase